MKGRVRLRIGSTDGNKYHSVLAGRFLASTQVEWVVMGNFQKEMTIFLVERV